MARLIITTDDGRVVTDIRVVGAVDGPTISEVRRAVTEANRKPRTTERKDA